MNLIHLIDSILEGRTCPRCGHPWLAHDGDSCPVDVKDRPSKKFAFAAGKFSRRGICSVCDQPLAKHSFQQFKQCKGEKK